MMATNRKLLLASLSLPLLTTLLGGCIYRKETVAERTAPPAAVVIEQPSTRVVTYADGRYQLYGDATTGYYWVWIPAGTNPPNPPPPPPVARWRWPAVGETLCLER